MNSDLSPIMHDLNNNLKACYLMLNKINDEENINELNKKLLEKILNQEDESNRLMYILKNKFNNLNGEFYEKK